MPFLLRIVGILFFPLVMLYTFIVFCRNKFYDWSWFRSCEVNAPVISVGNIQTGGTGKTPFVEYIVQNLLNRRYLPIILSRGYLRKNKEPLIVNQSNRSEIGLIDIGDEPYLLKENLPTVPLGIDHDRCRISKKLLQKYPDGVFVLDDGFQHRRLPRNIDIVLVDVTRWSFVPLLFPLTYMRDVKSSLKRASIIVLTRIKHSLKKTRRLRHLFITKYQKPVFLGEFQLKSVMKIIDNQEISLSKIAGKKIAAFCGIGNPDQFFELIKDIGCHLCWEKSYPDHFVYKNSDIEEIIKKSFSYGAEFIVTTQKDAVKIIDFLDKLNTDIYYLKPEISINDEDKFWKLITDYIKS